MPFFEPTRAELLTGAAQLTVQLSDVLTRLNRLKQTPLDAAELRQKLESLESLVAEFTKEPEQQA